MKYLKQFLLILIITCIGEILHYILPLPVPASIYGLVLMFVLLMTGIIKLENVKTTAQFLIEIMPVMFIPAAVGLINYWADLKPILLPALILTVLSTVIVMASTGLIAQFMIQKERGKKA